MGEPSAAGIRIRLFAGLREQAGWAERQWTADALVEATLTPRQLWQTLQLPGELNSVRVAINQQFAAADTPYSPAMSWLSYLRSAVADAEGLQLKIDLHLEAFEPLACLEQWQRQLAASGPSTNASAAESVFIGRVRAAAADGTPLLALELEHYPGMTERQLQQLATGCCARHGVGSCLVQHRIGRVLPGEAIVLVAIGADRRGPAQRCCQELLEALKHDAPFWKREWRRDGTGEWLTSNTPL